jgi:phospholipase C
MRRIRVNVLASHASRDRRRMSGAMLHAAAAYGLEPLEARLVMSAAAGSTLGDINHIIVIYQENWSFDALYGHFPGANGLANATDANGNLLPQYQQVDKNGNPITTLPNPSTDPHVPGGLPAKPYDLSQYVAPDQKTNDIVHRFYTEQLQIGNGVLQPGTGQNNKFVTWSDNKNIVLSNFDATNLPEGLLAQQYTMDDNFFHAAYGGSFLNHQFLVAADAPRWNQPIPTGFQSTWDPATQTLKDGNLTIDGKYAVNTTFSANLVPSFSTPGAATLMNSINDSNPNDPNRPYEANIGDRLSAAGVGWKWYSGGWDAAVNLQKAYQSGDPAQIAAAKAPFNDPTNPLNLFQWHHQPFAYFDNYAPLSAGGQAHLQDENNFFSDLSSGNLPAVSFIKPLGPDNEHPGYTNLLQGQQHVADIVHAVQNSPDWAHTAIIITYDENGGRWDHVAPPVTNDGWGDGARVPGIVISPFARQGYVDHTQHDTLSILSTIEKRFDVQPLNDRDGSASTLESSLKLQPAFSDLSGPTIKLHTPTVKLSGKLSLGSQVPAGDNVTVTLNGASAIAVVQGDGTFSATLPAAALKVGSYTVTYDFGGDATFAPASGTSTLNVTFGIAIKKGEGEQKHAGSTLPIQLGLTDASGQDASDPAVGVTAVGIASTTTPDQILPANSPGNSNPGGTFTFDGGGNYHFDLKTTGLAPGSYLFYFKVDGDPILHSFEFTLT